MSSYFDLFPVVNYQGNNLRNLMLSARIPQGILANISQFMPYTIKDGEHPTTLAFNYYGDISFVWLIAVANNIIDFYTQWPKSLDQMNEYIVNAYGSVNYAQSTIDHYSAPTDPTYPNVTPTSYQYLSSSVKSKLQAVTIYDQLLATNDNLRQIQLVPAAYGPRLQLELETALNASD